MNKYEKVRIAVAVVVAVVADVVKDAVNQANTPSLCCTSMACLFDSIAEKEEMQHSFVSFRPSISQQETGGLSFSLFFFSFHSIFPILHNPVPSRDRYIFPVDYE